MLGLPEDIHIILWIDLQIVRFIAQVFFLPGRPLGVVVSLCDDGPANRLGLEYHLKMARSTGCTLLEEAIKRTGIRVLLTTRWLDNQRLPHPPDFHEQLIPFQ